MSRNPSPLERYLRSMEQALEERGHQHLSVHGYVLRRGRRFDSQPLSREEQEYLDLHDWRRHQPRQCWRNAQLMALTLPPEAGMTLLYVEGYLRNTGHDFGVSHAWVSLNGKVVDTTVRIDLDDDDSPRPLGVIPEGWEYLGVELDPQECLHSMKHRSTGPLIDDWQCGSPLLRRELEPESHQKRG